MEKGTGKVALGKKAIPLFWKNFHFLFVSHCYRSSTHLVSSGSVKNIWKNPFLFYNFVKHSWSCGLSLICEFKSGLLIYSLLGLRFLSSGCFFFAAAVFHNINAPHRCVCEGGRGGRKGEGGGAWINIRYWTTIWTQKRCNTQLPQTAFYYVTLIITMFRKLINLTHWKMSMTVPGEI